MPEWKRLLVYEYGLACVTRATAASAFDRNGGSRNKENVERYCLDERARRQAELYGVKL